MAKTRNCQSQSRRCYTRKDGKKCLTPNLWIIFLRTHKNDFKSVAAASDHYKKKFRPFLQARIKKEMVNKPKKDEKLVYRKVLCTFFYNEMKKKGVKMPANKKKITAACPKSSRPSHPRKCSP